MQPKLKGCKELPRRMLFWEGYAVFNMGHYVGYTNYRNMVRVLYSYLSLSCLPPFGIDLGIFYAKTSKEDPYQLTEFVIPCHASHGVSSPEIEPSDDLGAREDQSIHEIESTDGPRIGDQPTHGVEYADSRAGGDQALVKNFLLLLHV